MDGAGTLIFLLASVSSPIVRVKALVLRAFKGLIARLRAVFQVLVPGVLFGVVAVCVLLRAVLSSGQQALVVVEVVPVRASVLVVALLWEVVCGVV